MSDNQYLWSKQIGETTLIPPGEVFFLPDSPEVAHKDRWKKLFLFATRCKTRDVDGEIGHRDDRPYPIEWTYLRKLLWSLLYTDQLVVFKVRQIMATWTLALLYLWEAMAIPSSQSMFISKSQREAKAFLGHRIAYMYKRLPTNWQTACRITRRVKDEAEWDNGAKIMAFPSVAVSGRSFTLSRAVADEAGFIQHCVDLKDSLRACLGARGKCAFVSTPYEVESDFEQLVLDAEDGKGDLLKFPLELISRDRGRSYRSMIDRKLSDMSEKGRQTEYGLKFAIKEENALFPTFDPKVHIVPTSEIVDRYHDRCSVYVEAGREDVAPCYCGADPHVTKPTAALWMLVMPDGHWHYTCEMWERGNVAKVSRIIEARENHMRVVDRVMDPSGNMAHKLGGMNPVRSQFREEGVHFRTARRDRIGIDAIQTKLEPDYQGRPGLTIDPSCKRFIRQMRTAGMKTEVQASKKSSYDHVDCAKYIANCNPVYDQVVYRAQNAEDDDQFKGLRREFAANVKAAQRGANSKWSRVKLS